MTRYARIANGVVMDVIESDIDPDGINGAWVACGNASHGYTYDGTKFTAPEVVVKPDPCMRLIDIGPFFDRFGPSKIPVLADTDATVKAIVTDCLSRKWIDLDRPDVALAIDAIKNKGHNVDKAAILDSPVLPAENLALRKLYFS